MLSNRNAINSTEILTPAEKAGRQYQENLLKTKLPNPQPFTCGQDLLNEFEHASYGKDIGKCNKEKKQIILWRQNQDIDRLLKTLPHATPQWQSYVDDVYQRVVELYERRKTAAKAAVQSEADFIKLHEEVLKTVEKNLSEMRADQGLALEQKKNKTPRVFTPEEKERMLHVQAYGQEDLTRNHSNLTKKKTNVLEQIQQCNQAISSLKTERKPFDKKVAELKTEIDGDLDEPAFKDAKLSLEYQELRIKKIEVKIEKLENEKTDSQTQLDKLDRQISVLNCALDKLNLLNEIRNFEDRKARTVARLEKILNERADLYTMRENLNKQWVELTTEEEPEKKTVSVFSQSPPKKEEELCQALCLKASAKIYFI